MYVWRCEKRIETATVYQCMKKEHFINQKKRITFNERNRACIVSPLSFPYAIPFSFYDEIYLIAYLTFRLLINAARHIACDSHTKNKFQFRSKKMLKSSILKVSGFVLFIFDLLINKIHF